MRDAKEIGRLRAEAANAKAQLVEVVRDAGPAPWSPSWTWLYEMAASRWLRLRERLDRLEGRRMTRKKRITQEQLNLELDDRRKME